MEQSAPLTLRDAQHSRHAFSHAPAALRIFRFAADSAPRVLELAHVSEFLRECAVEFGSADAALPGALRCEYAAGRYFALRAVVERRPARCPWLREKILACRGGAPVPAAALVPDVTRHDVDWGAEGARRNAELRLTHGGFGLARGRVDTSYVWTQGAVGVTSGKHFFQVCTFAAAPGDVTPVGWVDDKISTMVYDSVGFRGTNSTGATYNAAGMFSFGTAPLAAFVPSIPAPANQRPCVIGCLLDLAATPARMTVFVDGEPLAVQCEYDFPKDGRAWFPSVSLFGYNAALHSCTI
jgi:hypothetical protein